MSTYDPLFKEHSIFTCHPFQFACVVTTAVRAYQAWQRHASDGADKLDRRAVMNITITYRELFRLTLIVVHFNTHQDIFLPSSP